MFPASLIHSCHPPCNSASLTPYHLACLPHCLPHFPTSFTPSLPLPGSPTSLSALLTPLFHSLCLIHSLTPCLIHSPASLIHFFTQSLPHSPLPNITALLSPSITPLPPSFTFLHSHCITTPLPLTHSCPTLSLNHSPPSSLLASLTASFTLPSFTP